MDAPSRSDRFVGGLAELIGGRLGDHAVPEPAGGRPGRFWSAGRIVLALTCLTLVAHWLQKSPCRQGETWVLSGQLSQFCYSDIMALYGAEGGLSQGGLPYLDYPLEYPVLTGYLMSLVGWPVNQLGAAFGINEFTWFYDGNALLLGICGVASVALLLSLRRRRPWDAMLFAASPALLLSATVNWDLLPIVLAVGGLLAWARRRPVLAGVLLGLGTAAKLWPGFLLLPLIVLALRTGRHRPAWLAVAAAVGAWVAANLPAVVGDYLRNGSIDNWLQFLRLNTDRAIDWGTFWYVGQYLDRQLLTGPGPFQWLGANVDPHLNWLTYGLFALSCVGVGVLALKAPQPPRVAALAFLTVAAFLLFNKVWSQQFVLWLLPLVVLARPRWGAFLAWQAAEVAYFFTFYGQLLRGVGDAGRPEGQFVMPEGWFILAATLRWGTVVLLCVYIIHDALHPRDDVVRRSYRDDPAGPDPEGGVFNDPPGGSSRTVQVEQHHPVDIFSRDPQLLPGLQQDVLPRGVHDPVRQDDHRRDAE
ncbi:DUF2029 domain-containing protein [Natronosporangium hydrolyticum]|uniref:DUF2029 domain-containing protein n=1 Tax=Natronosporangium hydrolyticum TaxID=2811111 RepID=A0A895YQ19_9ACTN|nr:glycosyltransferase 87 family protein [Natronosporangium hydrolyticum]QSB17579.1 DUF2029 domain-containing protein [Natronosporangium hydrolyticum]